MTNLQQIKQVSAELYLNLDSPQSVRQQLQRINQAQSKLNHFKQEVNSKLQEMKQPETSFGLDEVAAIGLHIFGEHHLANHVTRQGNRAERQDRQQQQKARQPQIKMRELIDNYIFEGDRLKTMANNYLQEHS
ncbi:MAG: hypothetical protein HC939_11410 [Pleurocapsa sp. SU_5_0]|nr:hypothetical protein [Pleurocapsa sp. SU_5_0]